MNPFAWSALALVLLAPLPAGAGGFGVPSSRWGVGFGNSTRFTGLRFNVADKDVERVSGLNFTLGVPIDGRHYGPLAGEFDGINLGLLGPLGRRFDGITLSPTIMRAEQYRGIMVATAILHDEDLRGFAVAPLIVDGELGSIDGVAVAGFAVRATRLRGLSLGLVGNPIREVHGVVFGGINVNESVTGVQIGLWNMADQLNGLQLGLLNYAGSNAPPFRCLPLVNAHFSL